MVELQSNANKKKKSIFGPSVKIFFGIGANKYDAAWREVTQEIDPLANLDEIVAKVEQGIKDLKTCINDIEIAREHFARFDVTDMGENDKYLLLDVSDKNVIDAARTDLKKRIRTSPELNFFIVMTFAAHGL